MYVRTLWCDYRDKLAESGLAVTAVRHPLIGNPAGAMVGDQVIPAETLRHTSTGLAIRDLLTRVPDAVMVEIGGGFGGQAFQVLSLCRDAGAPVRQYLDFDIPEVLFVASYFLMTALPAERFRLYGEGDVVTGGGDYTIGLFPHYAIAELPASSADLVFNSNSFSEMDESSSRAYLAAIDRVSRRYFMHINHEVRLQFQQPDGTLSRNAIGSELVPDPASFTRVYKKPRFHGRPEDSVYPAFEYLYERALP